MSDLEPCPFCGAKPHWQLGKITHDQLHGDPHQSRIIVCPHLCVRMEGAEDGVVDRWNRRAAHARIEAQAALIADLTEALRWAYDTLQEINVSNYDHDDVCNLNAASVEVILGIAPTIARAEEAQK